MSINAALSTLAGEQPDYEPVRNRIRSAIAQGNATGVAVGVAHSGRIV